VAFGSCDLGMGGKLERYVNQRRDSKSSRNGPGQPPSLISAWVLSCVLLMLCSSDPGGFVASSEVEEWDDKSDGDVEL
jgi:hypothetical protein